MSWSPRMVREAYFEGPRIKVKRLKTNKWITVGFEPHEYPCVITKLRMDIGEIIVGKNGKKARITGFEGPTMHLWTYTAYDIEFIKETK